MDERLGRRGKLLAALLGQGGEVETSAGKEVLGLTDVHPKALQVERVQLVVANHGGESLLLDGSGSKFNPLEDRGVEDVETCIDSVSDKLNGLLDETLDTGGVVWLVDDHTVF